jgi:hypothetical protein
VKDETLDLFAVPSELEAGEPAVEPERKEIPVEDRTGEIPGSIRWYAEKQREYWNLAFPHSPK